MLTVFLETLVMLMLLVSLTGASALLLLVLPPVVQDACDKLAAGLRRLWHRLTLIR